MPAGELDAMLSAVKWGAHAGLGSYLVAQVGLTLLGLALFPTGGSIVDHPGVLIFACLGIFLLLFAFSAAGYYTGRETLKAGLGAVAGLVALALYAALSALYTPGAGASATAPAGASLSPVAQAIARGVAALFIFGLAALMGWLGGRPGAQNARRRLAATRDAKDATRD